MVELSSAAVEVLREAQHSLLEHALDRISATYPWYGSLTQATRDQIEAVAAVGVSMFMDAIDDPENAIPPSQIFSVAPATLTGTITLEQTLAMVRTVVELVEEEAPELVGEADRDSVRIMILIVGRDIGFAAAEVYARAAEARGAWDARVESVAIDAILHEPEGVVLSRVESAGWHGMGPVQAIASHATVDALEISKLRHECARLADNFLLSVRGDSVIVVLGVTQRPGPLEPAELEALHGTLDEATVSIGRRLVGATVIGPIVGSIAEAGRSLRSALSGVQALGGWPEAPCPVRSDELLPERLISGDELAIEQLIALVYEPLVAMGPNYVLTLSTYLATGRSLEGTARELVVHPNTVRYRLMRIAQELDWDPTVPRDSLTLHMALMAGRLHS